jgi:hypothetical protein
MTKAMDMFGVVKHVSVLPRQTGRGIKNSENTHYIMKLIDDPPPSIPPIGTIASRPPRCFEAFDL